MEHPKLEKWWQISENFHFERDTFDLLGVPVGHRYSFIENILPQNDEQTNLLNTLNKVIRGRRGAFVFVSGGKDTGKTLIGGSFINSVGRWSVCYDRETGTMTDWQPRFVTMQDLIDRITAFRSTRDWYREYCYISRVLVIDRWNLTDGKDPLTPAIKRKLENLLKVRDDNNFTTILLSRLLWADAYEQFTPAFRQELPDMYIRPLAHAYRPYNNPFEDEADYE